MNGWKLKVIGIGLQKTEKLCAVGLKMVKIGFILMKLIRKNFPNALCRRIGKKYYTKVKKAGITLKQKVVKRKEECTPTNLYIAKMETGIS